MNNRTRVSPTDLSALVAYCEGVLEGADPPIPSDVVLRLAAHVLTNATTGPRP